MSKTRIIGIVRDKDVVKAGVEYPPGTLIIANGTASLPTGDTVVIATGAKIFKKTDPWTPNFEAFAHLPSWK